MRGAMDAEVDAAILGQANLLQCLFSSVECLALKCAVELRIADIIHSHGRPMTLIQIAIEIGSTSPSLDINYLAGIMRFLVHKQVFDEMSQSHNGESLYSLNQSSNWLLQDAEQSLVPLVFLRNHPFITPVFQCLSQCVKEGGTAFQKTHGREMFEFASVNPEFNLLFNQGMACTAKITTKAMISEYGGIFDSIGSLVDVGGGTGAAVAEIVKVYPHIEGKNFDLPHVVATAPVYNGVTHVGGDMFKAIPQTDVILMKWIMHSWSDEDCIKILKNCREAIPEKTGKIIIVDMVLQPGGDGPFDKVGLMLDLVMLALYPGGKERTEVEWKKILEEGGFPSYKIIKIPALQSIIEAYPL